MVDLYDLITDTSILANILFNYVDGAMHFIYSHKYNTKSAEDSSDMTEYYSEHIIHVITLARARTPIA